MTIFQKYICIKKRTQIDMLNSMMEWIFKKYESQQKPKFKVQRAYTVTRLCNAKKITVSFYYRHKRRQGILVKKSR